MSEFHLGIAGPSAKTIHGSLPRPMVYQGLPPKSIKFDQIHRHQPKIGLGIAASPIEKLDIQGSWHPTTHLKQAAVAAMFF